MHFLFQNLIVLPLEEKYKFVLDVKGTIHTFVIFFLYFNAVPVKWIFGSQPCDPQGESDIQVTARGG